MQFRAPNGLDSFGVCVCDCRLDKWHRETNHRGVSSQKTRPNNLQLKLPAFLLDVPTDWAIQNHWQTTAHKPGVSAPSRPHVSFAISAAVAGLKQLSRTERQRILLNGARFILAEQDRLGIDGKQRIRLHRSETIRPAGAKAA